MIAFAAVWAVSSVAAFIHQTLTYPMGWTAQPYSLRGEIKVALTGPLYWLVTGVLAVVARCPGSYALRRSTGL